MRLVILAIGLLGCSDPPGEPGHRGPEAAVVLGEAREIVVDVRVYDDTQVKWLVVEGELCVLALHRDEQRLHLLRLDGEVVEGPLIADQFDALHGTDDAAVLFVGNGAWGEVYDVEREGFRATGLELPMGRWGGRTGDTLIAELDGLSIVDLSTGTSRALRQPNGDAVALFPSVGHGLYADGHERDLYVYDVASGWWEEIATPTDASLTWKAFDGPSHLFSNAWIDDGELALLHIAIPSGHTERFDMPSLGGRGGSPVTVGDEAWWTEWVGSEKGLWRMAAAPMSVQ